MRAPPPPPPPPAPPIGRDDAGHSLGLPDVARHRSLWGLGRCVSSGFFGQSGRRRRRGRRSLRRDCRGTLKLFKQLILGVIGRLLVDPRPNPAPGRPWRFGLASCLPALGGGGARRSCCGRSTGSRAVLSWGPRWCAALDPLASLSVKPSGSTPRNSCRQSAGIPRKIAPSVASCPDTSGRGVRCAGGSRRPVSPSCCCSRLSPRRRQE